MSSVETGGASSTATPNYGATSAGAQSDLATARNTRATTGFGFFRTIYGLLNVVIIIAIVCVLISAGVASASNCKLADSYPSYFTSVKISAYHTRNAVLAFAIIGLILILLDTIFHVTGFINRLPASFDTIFIIIMLVLGGIYLILGCCAAAWEQKMKDTVNQSHKYIHKGSAGAASFFLFVAMVTVLADFILRLVRSPPRE